MQTKLLPLWVAAGMCGISAMAQNSETKPPLRPLTEEGLLKKIDGLGKDIDPAKKRPASAATAPQKSPPAAKVQDAPAGSPVFPQPHDAAPEKKEKRPKGATEITARETNFDQKTHQAVFTGEVAVDDPEFNLVCERLTALLRHEDPAPARPPAPANNAATPGAASDKPKKGGLEKAIAEGKVVVIQEKPDANGVVTKSIGKSKRLDYVAASGEITLTGNPEVQQGMNTCVATEEGTVMTLTREGKMRVVGPHKMVIRDKVDEK